MTAKASAIIRLRFPSERRTTMILRALRPETEGSPTYRSTVQVTQEERTITLTFEAKDTTALRASVNSYLSWLQLLNIIYDTLELQRA